MTSARTFPAAAANAVPRRVWMIALLCPLLVLSAQTLAYVTDFLPTYYLSKAWPVLSLPLAAAAVVRRRQPGTMLLLILFGYTMVLTPIVSMVEFHIGFGTTMQTVAKVGGFLSYFSLLEVLLLLRPSVAEVRSAALWLGAVTFGLIWLLWILVPASYYQTNAAVTQTFLFDLERGYRIYAPMMFGFFLMFHTARRFWLRPQLWRVLLLVFAFASLLIIYKEKLAILATLLVIVIGGVTAYPRYYRLFFALGLAGGAAGLFLFASADTAALLARIGGSLSVRVISADYAIDFLRQNPLRWFIGAGALPQHSGLNLGDFFRFNQFYLSDLGWLGILFEYGLLGTGLIVAVYVMATREIWAVVRRGDAWSLALLDYALYLWIVYCVYSAIVAPGEIMTVLTLAVYTGLQRQRPGQRPHRSIPIHHAALQRL